MTSGIPEWAANRAAELFAEERAQNPDGYNMPVLQDAFARFIAAHEQPPDDPIREALAETYGHCQPAYLARFHVELVKHGLQIISTGATK